MTIAVTVADAAVQGGLGRIVFFSYVGAAADSSNAYLRSEAEAEALLLPVPRPTPPRPPASSTSAAPRR